MTIAGQRDAGTNVTTTTNIRWFVARTVPVARVEFSALHAITQREIPAMVPFEMEKIRKPRSNNRGSDWKERKKALFPFYVFLGLHDYDEFRRLRASVNKAAEDIGKKPPLMGLIGFSHDQHRSGLDRYARLSTPEVEFLRSASMVGAHHVNIYKPVQLGDAVTFSLGSRFEGRTGIVDAATRNRVKVMTLMFGQMVIVEEERARVTVAA